MTKQVVFFCHFRKQASDLAEKLQYLPLALEQATGYIAQLGISIKEYIKELEKQQVG